MKRVQKNMPAKPFVYGGVYDANVAQANVAQANVAQTISSIPDAVPPSATSASAVGKMPAPDPTPAPISCPLNAQIPVATGVVKGDPSDTSSSMGLSDIDGGNGDVEMDINNVIDNGGRVQFKKIFLKRKKSSQKARDKKIRQNRQLRKAMFPKSALMALNEVKGINISDFTINSNSDGGFTAIVMVNSTPYEGKGHSKMAAKNLACEKALRDYIIAKMTKKTIKPVTPAGQESMEVNDEDTPDENDVPMLNLASFAIYKLFSEWEREGFIVPEMHPSAGNNSESSNQPGAGNPPGAAAAVVPKEPKKPPLRTELPPNWETMHPATLLCIMRPGILYVDHGSSGEKRLGVVVDQQEFTATGRSKKIARRNVAVNVCNTLFNTNFAYEEY